METTVAEILAPDSPLLGLAVAARQAYDAVDEPDDPPIRRAELAGRLFLAPPGEPRRGWVVTVGGRPAGLLVAERTLDGENDAVVEVELVVVHDLRRRGAARALLRAALPVLAAAGCTELIAYTFDDAGDELSRALGLTERQVERCSRLRVADVDEAQQRAWRAGAPAAGRGYRLVQWTGSCPEAHLPAFRQAVNAMVDAPRDGLDVGTPLDTLEQVRDREATRPARAVDAFTTLALSPGGDGAGMSQLFVPTGRPQIGFQGDTGVVAAHRGHRLGRWLKAANLAQARAAHPELAVVQTTNAESNPWMLAINADMGFRPHRRFGASQGSLAGALSALDPATNAAT